MSYPLPNIDFWQDMWDKHHVEYLAECREAGVQADLSDFQVWCDDNDLTGDDEAYTNV